MAGPGLNGLPDGSFVLGSTLVALRAEPRFTRCIAVEKDASAFEALEQRVSSYGRRAITVPGDCNRDLVPVMQRYVPEGAATLVFLDPEGYQLDFATIRQVSEFRPGPRKPELLVLVDTADVPRTASAQRRRDDDFGPWRHQFALPINLNELMERYLAGDLSADELRESVADGFCEKLRSGLGYEHAFARRITRGSRDGAAVYHLAFASDHDRGAEIMEYVFENMHSNDDPRLL